MTRPWDAFFILLIVSSADAGLPVSSLQSASHMTVQAVIRRINRGQTLQHMGPLWGSRVPPKHILQGRAQNGVNLTSAHLCPVGCRCSVVDSGSGQGLACQVSAQSSLRTGHAKRTKVAGWARAGPYPQTYLHSCTTPKKMGCVGRPYGNQAAGHQKMCAGSPPEGSQTQTQIQGLPPALCPAPLLNAQA